jgi:pimeloyl-ACP methyl ester carboxylesterase
MATMKAAVSFSDDLGLSALAVDAATSLTDLVEQTHNSILNTRAPFGTLGQGLTSGVSRFVYRGVCGGIWLTGAAIGNALVQVRAKQRDAPASRRRDIALAALNGLVGDHLVETGNPLALPMRLRHDGQTLALDRRSLSDALPNAAGRVVVLVHGLGMSDLQWRRQNHDHGAALAEELGYTPVYLFYNSGLHISINGREFAAMLEALIARWPIRIDDLVLIGHSMGGLVARSACRYGELAGHLWRRQLRKLVFLGTPHHGAPLERIGNWVEHAVGKTTYASAFTKLGRIRSAGVTDLRYGKLLDEDWEGRNRFASEPDTRNNVPLPAGVTCYAIAGTTANSAGGLVDRFVGDGLVPVESALGRHRDPTRALTFPTDRQSIACNTGHFDLLSRRDVYEQIARWLSTAK